MSKRFLNVMAVSGFVAFFAAWFVFGAYTLSVAKADTPIVTPAPACPDIIPAEMLSASEIDVGTKLCKFMKSELMTIGRVRGRVDVTCQDGKVFMIGGSGK